MIEYRPKCRDFMDSVGLEEYVVRTDKMSVDVLKDRMTALLERGEKYRASGRWLRSFARLQAAVASRIVKTCAVDHAM